MARNSAGHHEMTLFEYGMPVNGLFPGHRWSLILFTSSIYNGQIQKEIILLFGKFNHLFFNVCSLYSPIFIAIGKILLDASFFAVVVFVVVE